MKLTRWLPSSGLAMFAAGTILAGGLIGSWVAEGEPGLTLMLEDSADGVISGALAESGMSMPLSGRRVGDGFAGFVGAADEGMPFTASLEGETLVLEIGDPGMGERMTFRRADAAPGAAPEATPATDDARNVTINGRRYTDDELAQIERTYRIRIPVAEYWYDATLGAWGVRGSPTLGFIAPGLDLGGPLAADASRGDSGIFVNGRELHRLDVLALQRITGPIQPGRYFIRADGLAGFEGGPPLWNLAAQAAPEPGGGSNTWQSRLGASGFSDGTTGAVFLPNGGIVSTGN